MPLLTTLLANPFAMALLSSLAKEVPAVCAKIFAHWVQKGLVTPEELADFMASWKSGDSFFTPGA